MSCDTVDLHLVLIVFSPIQPNLDAQNPFPLPDVSERKFHVATGKHTAITGPRRCKSDSRIRVLAA